MSYFCVELRIPVRRLIGSMASQCGLTGLWYYCSHLSVFDAERPRVRGKSKRKP
jgi:hypothetical protein